MFLKTENVRRAVKVEVVGEGWSVGCCCCGWWIGGAAFVARRRWIVGRGIVSVDPLYGC